MKDVQLLLPYILPCVVYC